MNSIFLCPVRLSTQQACPAIVSSFEPKDMVCTTLLRVYGLIRFPLFFSYPSVPKQPGVPSFMSVSGTCIGVKWDILQSSAAIGASEFSPAEYFIVEYRAVQGPPDFIRVSNEPCICPGVIHERISRLITDWRNLGTRVHDLWVTARERF